MKDCASEPELIHATAISLEGEAALIRGPSGSGKSDLALRCLAAPTSPLIPVHARLVSDDQVSLARSGRGIIASAPDAIRNKLEVRGLGIVPVEAVPSARVVLVVDLVSKEEVERFPLTNRRANILGCELPLMRLAPFEASSAIKLLLALSRNAGANGLV